MPVNLMKDEDRITVKDSELVAGGDPDTTYELRPLTREIRKEIIKRNTAMVPNGRTHVMEPRIDQEAVGWDLVDYALVGWTGILWHGQPAPCEREYKLKLDEPRANMILQKAGLSQVIAAEVARPESFRGPTDVRRVVGG